MKTIFATAALLSTVLFAAAPAHADQSYDSYRRVVLGDTSIPAPASVAVTGAQVVPGPYAQYLINTGADKSQAIAAAARIGEQALTQTVAAAPQRQLTAAQAYAKYLGYTPRTSEAVGSAE